MRFQASVLWALVGTLLATSSIQAAPRLGRAMISAVEGNATAESPNGSFPIEEGMALSRGQALTTAEGASVCTYLTPGAILCVHENSRLEFQKLEHSSPGLTGDQPLNGRIEFDLARGAILVNSTHAPEGLNLVVGLGPDVQLAGPKAKFVVASGKSGCQVFVEEGTVTLHNGQEQTVAGEKQTMAIKSAANGTPATATVEDGLAGEAEYEFYVCRELFPMLESTSPDWDWDREGVSGEAVVDGVPIALATLPDEALDVSPSLRIASSRPPAAGIPSQRGGGEEGDQRRRVDMWQWYRGVGALRGCNYLPRTAVNTTEMWQESTFDRETIDQELGWAHDSGLNSVRVLLPFMVWQQDAEGLKARMREFLDMADRHALTTAFVLFDDYDPHGIEPYLGPQRPPTAGVHNSQWTPSPGPLRVADREGAWPDLKKYVSDIVGSFRGDDRVLFWDLYNDLGRSHPTTDSVDLALAAFTWARDAKPTQPLTAGINSALKPEAALEIMKASDVITFAGYATREDLEGSMGTAGLRGRPVICTGWLDRTEGMQIEESLPMFSERHVGWFVWGLVAGRSQLYVPQEGAARTEAEGSLWAQDLLNAEGKPYDESEVDHIRQFRFEGW